MIIADGADEFVRGCDLALELARGDGGWRDEVDLMLANLSWDITQARMAGLIGEAIAPPTPTAPAIGARRKQPLRLCGRRRGLRRLGARRAAGQPA